MILGRGLTQAILLLALLGLAHSQQSRAILRSGFIFEDAPFRSAHASTIVETGEVLVAGWFGGTAEGHQDVGIWISRNEGGGWSRPLEVATGRQEDGSRHPCWNPVLFQTSNGPLLLFYKVGPSPRDWWSLVKMSVDHGRTWSEPIRLPDGVLGPIRAKPIELRPGTLLAGSSTEHDGWVVHMERFDSEVQTEDEWRRALASPDAWEQVGPLNDPDIFGAIQPTILVHSSGELQILCRSQQKFITQVWSDDGGVTWGPMLPTELPNPSAGIDAVRLHDGRFLLAYNPTLRGRRRLVVAVSDDGRSWRRVVTLEDEPNGEFSYPALIETSKDLVHVTYTWRRQRIRHVVIDPSRID